MSEEVENARQVLAEAAKKRFAETGIPQVQIFSRRPVPEGERSDATSISTAESTVVLVNGEPMGLLTKVKYEVDVERPIPKCTLEFYAEVDVDCDSELEKRAETFE